MELTFECPNCGMIDHVDSVETAPRALCRHCQTSRDLASDWVEGGAPARCPVCASAEMYVRKDFPQEVGLAVVLAGFAAGVVFWYYGMRASAYAALGASVLADMAIYRLMPDVLACYRCGGQIRGPGINRSGRFRPRQSAVVERHRRERGRAVESPPGGILAESNDPEPDAS